MLDGSRIHPETYEWARKMAVDALEYDDEDANPAGAVEEILETPERLKVGIKSTHHYFPFYLLLLFLLFLKKILFIAADSLDIFLVHQCLSGNIEILTKLI